MPNEIEVSPFVCDYNLKIFYIKKKTLNIVISFKEK